MKSTKELARKLGLLRKRSVTSQQDRELRKASKTFEFPAVLLNTSNGEIESEFHSFVLPEENPILSNFCTEFTGITQAQVESGAPLSVCLSQFKRWLRKMELEKCIAYNSTQDKEKKLCTFVTWSDWDLAICLHYECKRKQLVKPPALTSWIDLRATYKNFYQRKPQGLHGALQDVGIEFHGRQHSGLDDSRNTAKLAWRMICDGCVMKITRTMQGDVKRKPPAAASKPATSNQASNQARCQSNNQAKGKSSTQAKIQTTLLSHVNPSSITHSTKNNPAHCHRDDKLIVEVLRPPPMHSTSNRLHSNTSDINGDDIRPSEDLYGIPSDTQEMPLPDDDVSKDICEDYIGKDDCADDDFMTATQAIAWQDKFGVTESASHTNMDMQNSTETRQPVANVMTPNVILTSIKTPILGQSSPTLGQRSGNTSASNSIVTVQTCLGVALNENTPNCANTKRLGLKRSSPYGNEQTTCQSSGQRTEKQNGPSPPKWTTTSGRTSEFKTPLVPVRKSPVTNSGFKTPPNPIPPGMLAGKITPPMCGCGRRAKKNNVVSPGPNQGRGFFSCPNRRTTTSESALGDSTNRRRKQGCGYFKWESVVIREKLATTSSLNFKPVRSPSPMLGYKTTPNSVNRHGQSYINSGMKGGYGLGSRRLGMSQRTFLKPPS